MNVVEIKLSPQICLTQQLAEHAKLQACAVQGLRNVIPLRNNRYRAIRAIPVSDTCTLYLLDRLHVSAEESCVGMLDARHCKLKAHATAAALR